MAAVALDPKLALYMGAGGYVGAMLVMEITTPSALLLPIECEQQVIRFFDEAPFLRRTGNGHEWMNSRGRLHRWDSDTLRLERVTEGILVTGGHRDLSILLEEVSALRPLSTQSGY